ncbi:Proline-rich receptor-like protein kinase PERK2 [Escovopsis weberi]|uniref:Proline-rich receptor-like protein kinase PERK2 n=1 Tax=Escovopsis weberi TaxID=150374 RepID=A0A0M8N2D9_ESCWE|nr:Proline-rich receptor-like protein kinase PERK2 [Escovopsis weberi]
MSLTPCGVSQKNAPPLCAETCAEYAQSEAYITADKELCTSPSEDLIKLIRADFTNCALPEQSLSGSCINGIDNEPDNCGFGNSTIGLCSYCSAGGINSTDTCCYNSNAENRCHGVRLPDITATLTFTAPTATATSSVPVTKPPASSSGRLSGGAIAGIVVGSVAVLVILAALLFFCIGRMRRKRGSQQGSIFNQPTPTRKGPPVTQNHNTVPTGYEVLPGGRVARMSALEGHSGNSPSIRQSSLHTSREAELAVTGKHMDNLSTSDFGGHSSHELQFNSLRGPPAASRRQASLSGNSMLGSEYSPEKMGAAMGFPSPHGVASNQSEQLPFFKDYYSQDDIHPGDKVAVLWAYQPRAVDEFALDRGDVLKVVGIWDDGWATGFLIDQRAEEWDSRRRKPRESDQSSTSVLSNVHGDLKAFPLPVHDSTAF